MFSPLMAALNTLPGILGYALIVTLLWSVGINGDNAVDVVVAPIFLQYLSANTAAVSQGSAPPFVTAYGFFTTFVNVGGTGATLALALLLCRSRDAGYRKVARLSLPTQVFHLRTDGLGPDPAPVHQRAVDDAAGPGALPRDRRRLACGGLGSRVNCHGNGGLLPVRTCRDRQTRR